MNYNKQVDKDRVVAHCSQCYDKIRLKCPVCLIEKNTRFCKIYKNTSSLWWHIKHEHNDFVTSDFDIDELCHTLNEITRAIKWGIIVT